jgi:Polyketide cyclase / dehydrase and lipid transport
MELAATIVIDCHIDDVFDFVCNPANDPRWCPKVLSVEQVSGDGPGPASRWEVVHRPSRFRPPRQMAYACVDWDPPSRIAWRADDGVDEIDVAYELEPVWTSTRITQRDDARLGAPRPFHPLYGRAIRRDMTRRLRALKAILERRSPDARS